MRVLCVIPARLGSSRLPRKPLCLLAGDPLIAVVASRALELSLFDEVAVATDSPEVAAAVAHLPVSPSLTGTHRCGTERVAEVAGRWAPPPDIVVNLQGDEPFIDGDAVRAVIDAVRRGASLATVGVDLLPADYTNRHRVKVVVDGDGAALRFARGLPASAAWTCDVTVRRHVGIYAYRADALARWAALAPSPEETQEDIEAMRPLAYGMRMVVAHVPGAAAPGIDTAQDLIDAESMMLLAERDEG